MSSIRSRISRGTRSIKHRVAGIAMMSFVFAAVCATSPPAFAQSAPISGGAGLSTGVISIAPGQSVRLSVVNVGGKVVHGESILVPVADKGGKVALPGGAPLVRSTWTVASGDAQSDVFPYPGVPHGPFYAQIRVQQDAGELNSLVPSLQIVDDQTGTMRELLSGFDFVSFRPIFNPPFLDFF